MRRPSLALSVLAEPVLLMVEERADVVVAVGVDKSAIPIHLVVFDLPLVNCAVVDDVATDAIHVAAVVQLSREVRELD